VLLLSCADCGTDNVAEKNSLGEYLLIPPVLAGLRGDSVREAEARGWIRENEILRAEFHARKKPEPAALYGGEPDRPHEGAPTGEPGDDPVRDPPPPPGPSGRELDVVLRSYEVLGLELTATPEEIRKRYRELSKKCHPDRVADLDDEIRRTAERRFREVRRAYEKLVGD
jgi:DnaJ-domain-containing protein 1